MPTLVAMGALYDSAVAASESIYGLGELEVVSDDSVAKKKKSKLLLSLCIAGAGSSRPELN